jgi:hypothetical protein
MFQDLDSTLQQILDDPAMPSSLADLRNADVSFETPDRNFSPVQPTVNLFLYEVKENRELRNAEPIIQKVGDTYFRRRAPIRMDCNYMVSAWSNATGPARVVAEHRLLAEALLWLSRFTTVPGNYLQGSLAVQPYPPPTIIAQVDPNRNTGEFWSALGISPRAAFYLTVTIAMDLDVEVEDVQVTTVIAWYQQDSDQLSREEWINIAGVVSDAIGGSVETAWVRLEPGGVSTTTDEQGRFILVRIRRGTNYTLRAGLPGKGETSRNIQIPSPSGEYNLQLP